MPTSATCGLGADRDRLLQRPGAASSLPGRRHRGVGRARGDRAAARGFTLLELLVVLLLAGLIATLALPDPDRLRTAFTTSTERGYILDQIAGLGRRAMLEERAYVVMGTRREEGAEAFDPPRIAREGARNAPPAHLSDTWTGGTSQSDYERYAIDLPEGWEIGLDEPLVVRANGVCLGAGLTLYLRGAEDFRVRLDPPYCRAGPDA